MLPPGNLIVSLYFRSFRIRIPPRPHTARSALRKLRRHKRKGIMADDATSATGGAASGSGGSGGGASGGGASGSGANGVGGLGLSRAVSKRIQFTDSTREETPDPEMTAMLSREADDAADAEKDGPAQASGPPDRHLNPVESWKEHSSPFAPDDDSDGPGEFEMYDDIYSMIFLCHFLSPASFFSLFTFGLKMVFFTFLILDLLLDNPENNVFGAPAGISNLVRIAQFFMLPVAVAMQEDLIGSIFLVNVHYDEAVLQLAPGATRGKWIFASGLRLFDGMYSLIVNFCLLLTSDTVLGLFLNFAALAFLQTVDNVAFHLALHGYLTESIEEVAHRTTKVKLPQYARGVWAVMDSVAFVAIFVAITIAWVIVTVQQIRGDFLCQKLGAEFNPEMFPPGENGAYAKFGTFTIALRAVYANSATKSSDGAPTGVFAFCPSRDYWTYTQTTKQDLTQLTADDVCRYTLRSPEVPGNYDITLIPPSDWFYRDHSKAGNDEPVSGFNLWCSSCEESRGRADCSDAGVCQAHQCVCDPGYYGMNCEYGGPIPSGQSSSGYGASSIGTSNLQANLDDEHQQDPHGRENSGDGARRRQRAEAVLASEEEVETLTEDDEDLDFALDPEPDLDLGGSPRALRPRRR